MSVENSITPPPGLVGDVARFIYAAAPRQVPEIALAGAIGFIAGIAGRAFNISATGLNHYVLLLAPTGTGKEAIKSGIDRIVATLSDSTLGTACAPSISNFVGPADMASGPGLLKAVSRRNPPSFVSIVGEFGLRFQQMADARPNAADTSLLRVLLDLFMKSGRGNIVGETVYSNKENNTVEIKAPAMSIIGESTPDTFFGHLNEAMVTNGLLPRFTIIEYTGERPPRNRDAATARPDPDMLRRLALLVTAVQTANATDTVKNVDMTADAETMLDQFDEFADAQIRSASSRVIKEVWTRAHLKALKLAASIAVGCDHEMPTITAEFASWACQQVERDIRILIERFEDGEVGGASGNETKQQNEVLRCIDEYCSAQFHLIPKSYGVIYELQRSGIVTEKYLSMRLIGTPAFKNDRIGATNALKRAINNLLEADDLKEMPKQETEKLSGRRPRAFVVASPSRMAHAIRKNRKSGV